MTDILLQDFPELISGDFGWIYRTLLSDTFWKYSRSSKLIRQGVFGKLINHEKWWKKRWIWNRCQKSAVSSDWSSLKIWNLALFLKRKSGTSPSEMYCSSIFLGTLILSKIYRPILIVIFSELCLASCLISQFKSVMLIGGNGWKVRNDFRVASAAVKLTQ